MTAELHQGIKSYSLKERCLMNLKEYILQSAGYTIVQPDFGDRNYKTENELEEHNKKSIRNYHCYFRMILIGYFYSPSLCLCSLFYFFGVLISQNNKRW